MMQVGVRAIVRDASKKRRCSLGIGFQFKLTAGHEEPISSRGVIELGFHDESFRVIDEWIVLVVTFIPFLNLSSTTPFLYFVHQKKKKENPNDE